MCFMDVSFSVELYHIYIFVDIYIYTFSVVIHNRRCGYSGQTPLTRCLASSVIHPVSRDLVGGVIR